MRPIDADALVAGLEESYKELRKLYDSIKDDAGAKDVYQGELITFLEAILRTRNAPNLDCEPVRHGEWVQGKWATYPDGYVCNRCSTGYAIPYSYCPNCGAKMDGGEEGWLNGSA